MDAVEAEISQIHNRIRHCQHIFSSSMDAISAIDGHLRDLDTERAREGYDPSTYENYVWRKMVLEFDKQRHDAIIDEMFEEFRNLSNLDDLHFDYLESLLETSGANNGGRA